MNRILKALGRPVMTLALVGAFALTFASAAAAQNFSPVIPIPLGPEGTPAKVMEGSLNERVTAGNFQLVMQSDGNLVLYRKSPAFVCWASNTNGNPNSHAAYQWDGNFVVARSNGTVLWASNTRGDWANDANVSIYNGKFWVGHHQMPNDNC